MLEQSRVDPNPQAPQQDPALLSRGVLLQGKGQVEFVTEPVPQPTGTQVLINTHAVGLCGSDMSLYKSTYQGPQNYPIFFGHEWSGTVTALGPQVTKVQPGDKVTGDCSIYCGHCQFCLDDKNLCQNIEKFGITINGASRQYFLQDEQYVYRADPSANLDLVALSEPLAVGAHAVRRVQSVRSDLAQEKILVLGGGTIGLSCFFALKALAGCQHVELFDLIESRMQRAQRLGAAPLSDVAKEESDGDDYGSLYSGQGYDAIFETTASPVAFGRAVNLVRPLGTIMTLGFLPSVTFSMKTITLKAACIMGSMGGTGEFETVLDFILQHPQMAGELITHRVPYTQVENAFAVASERQHAMKVLVQFQDQA
jgi:threonine dehydrogenase-like Zn-dependent dehydrogenase